jgi:hypothetical protein
MNTNTSVVDYMKSKNMNSAYSNRAKIAPTYGIKSYTGNSNQNISLLNSLKSAASKSVAPKSVAPKTPTPTVATPKPVASSPTTTLMQQSEGYLNDLYAKQQAAQLSQLQASQKKAVGAINQQKAELAPQYADKRNQADVVNAQNAQRLREMMANSGLQGSGENVTANVGLQSARQGAIGDLNTQEQGQLNDYNRQITDINDPAQAQAIVQQLGVEKAQAMFDAHNRADELGYNRSQDRLADYWTRRNYDASRIDRASDVKWREQQFNNMSASEKENMKWDKQKYGEDAAWRLYDQQYQGNLSKSQSDAELKAYTSP